MYLKTTLFYLNYSSLKMIRFTLAGPILKIKNATKHSTKKYECIAENGVDPSLSRIFTITVNCS